MSNLKLTSSSQNWEISAARIYNPNSSLTLDASGNYSLLLKTNGTTRLTISGTGLTTFGTLGSYDPSTNFFTATKFVGDLSGNATNVAITDTNTAGTFYPTFVSGSGSGRALNADISSTPLTYNPSTGILKSPVFSLAVSSMLLDSISSNEAIISLNSSSNILNKNLAIKTLNTAIPDTGASLIFNSGTNSSSPQVLLVAGDQNTDTTFSQTILTDSTALMRLRNDGGSGSSYSAGFSAFYTTPITTVLKTCVYSDDNGTTTGMRVSTNQIDFFGVGSGTNTAANIAQFRNIVGIYGISFLVNAQFTNGFGVIRTSSIDTTTTGTTILTTASAFVNIINTPSTTGRIYQLPALVGGSNLGYVYAFTNKSTTNIITINNSLSVAQITIPAGTVGGAGGYGAVAVDSAGTAYFRCG